MYVENGSKHMHCTPSAQEVPLCIAYRGPQVKSRQLIVIHLHFSIDCHCHVTKIVNARSTPSHSILGFLVISH